MISYQHMTTEDALRRAFKDDPGCIGRILNADDSDTINASITFTFSAPTKYAKAVLRDYLLELSDPPKI